MSVLNYLAGGDVIKFRTPHGHMEIKLKGFFPCGKVKLKKLFKVIRSGYGNDVETIKNVLTGFFEFEITENKQLLEHCPERIKRYMDEVYWLNKNKEKLLSEGKYKSKREFNEAVRHYKACADSIKEDQRRYERNIESYKNNLELLREL